MLRLVQAGSNFCEQMHLLQTAAAKANDRTKVMSLRSHADCGDADR